MKISVIVPVYNTQDYLRECVDSILNQSLSDIELILVDDGSTDFSTDIIFEYVERFPAKVKAICLDNGGQGRARNFGIDAAQGEFLSFIDSDDYLEKDALLHLYEAAVAENADVAVCDMEKRYDDGTREYVKAALQDAIDKEIPITDDCSAVERIGKTVFLVEGDEENLKITTPIDMILAEAILRRREGRL